MLRRSLIIGGLATATGRTAFAASPLTKGRGGGTAAPSGGGFSPDGTRLYGALGGGANTSLGAASLVMPYGTFTMGAYGGPEPHSAGGPGKMCQILLDGTPIAPGYLLGEGNPPWFAELQVANGGNVYGCHLNQIWYEFRGWCWASNPGVGPFFDYASGPSSSTLPIPAMVRSPPYTPSAEGTTITAPTSSTVTTAEGVWGFGSSHGSSGYALQLNGVDVGWSNIQNFIGVDIIKVCGYGQLAYHYPDNGSWYTWCLRQPNQTGGGAPANNTPIPIDIRLNPLRPDDPRPARTTGTFVSAVTVTMSNGSAFAGTYAISGQGAWNLAVSGNNLVVATEEDPVINNYFIPKVHSEQNNCAIDTYFSYATLP